MNLGEFKNQPLTDFSDLENRQAMSNAIAKVRSQLGREYNIIIGGKPVRCESQFQSLNPSRKGEVVGIFPKGTREFVERAISAAGEAFQHWSRVPVPKRVEYVMRVSQIMKERRLELAAWMVVEVGKSWVEADADVAETIDFCEFYSGEMLRLAGPQPLVKLESEDNALEYIPLGVGVIIPPWNFPLAILSGMTFAALVSGNTVIVKPSSDSPTIAAQLMQIVEEVGFPPGVVNFLTGSGEEIGDALVEHPRTRFIAFTGSKQVGLRINELAAKHQPGQMWIKRVIAEMGGKDAIVVDDESNLDEAAAAVVVSAFGYQGQKCSACSRAIVVDSVCDEFLQKLQQKTRTMIQEGDVERPEVNFGAVVNQKAQDSILRYIEIGRKEGQLLMGGKAGSSEGYFVRPTVISDVDPKASIAQEEVFGPVLAVIRARDYDEAIEIANQTEYGLTGSVYTQNKSKIEKAKREFHVGNLYINRKCTGALVGVHPFGGFNMSGTDSKAGGRDYLLLFTQAKSISEKVS
ncbi:L-glutamate gamma-semialdehyde dehydrogenase [Acidobacteria bacterium AH-259-L09]|nr:L-glutamate gamma-semialdehyde dehydrogenase [Acidobacteria bacterium AH-259-L09]